MARRSRCTHMGHRSQRLLAVAFCATALAADGGLPQTTVCGPAPAAPPGESAMQAPCESAGGRGGVCLVKTPATPPWQGTVVCAGRGLWLWVRA